MGGKWKVLWDVCGSMRRCVGTHRDGKGNVRRQKRRAAWSAAGGRRAHALSVAAQEGGGVASVALAGLGVLLDEGLLDFAAALPSLRPFLNSPEERPRARAISGIFLAPKTSATMRTTMRICQSPGRMVGFLS